MRSFLFLVYLFCIFRSKQNKKQQQQQQQNTEGKGKIMEPIFGIVGVELLLHFSTCTDNYTQTHILE